MGRPPAALRARRGAPQLVLLGSINRGAVDKRTEGEALFEAFCQTNALSFQPVPVSSGRTPDYVVTLSDDLAYFEIKQIDEDERFTLDGVSSRTVGAHIRQKIEDARTQIQYASSQGKPGVLLVYNNLDHMQLFGTDKHDFIFAMYGEMTINLVAGKAVDSFHGRNSKLRPEHNSSFSAVGHLVRTMNGPRVRLFENIYARYPLAYEGLPACFDVVRVEIEDAA